MSIISVAEFCDAAQIDQAVASNVLLGIVVGAAQERIEAYCNRTFETATFTEYHDIGDATTRHIYVQNPPITSVTSLQYDAQSDDPETVDSSDYITDTSSGKITLYNDEGYFGRGGGGGEQSIKVVYVGGYAAADMPDVVKLATILLAQHYWNVPEAIGRTSESVDGISQNFETYSDIPVGIRSLLAPYRRVSL